MFGLTKNKRRDLNFAITQGQSNKREARIFIKNIDLRRKRNQLPDIRFNVEHDGQKFTVYVPKELTSKIFNIERLNFIFGENIGWEFDGQNKKFQSMHYNYLNEDECVNFSFFREDGRTVINRRTSMTVLGNNDFFDFNVVEDLFNEKLGL